MQPPCLLHDLVSWLLQPTLLPALQSGSMRPECRDSVEDRANGVEDPTVSSLDCDWSCLPVMVSTCFYDATLISGYKHLEWDYKL